MTEPNPYKVLGVKRNASQATIKAAWKRKSKEAHPDAGGSDAAQAAVNAAYTLLSDPDARAFYDATGGAPKGSKHANPDMEAWKIVDAYVASFIREADDAYDDLVAGTIKGLKAAIGELRARIPQCRDLIAKCDRMLRRVKRDGEDNMLAAMIRSHKDRIAQEIAAIDAKLKLLERAVELLLDYGYVTDPVAREVQPFEFRLAGGGLSFFRLGP